jgi:DNA-binding CsgD family transcriptional regulator
MKVGLLKYTCLVILANAFGVSAIYGQNKGAVITGSLSIDDDWESIIYPSHIPTFGSMYEMSNEMIIAETEIDSLGYFCFDLDFLPCEDNLMRLHLTKKGDSKATLIIGGKDENFLFLIVNCNSNFHLNSLRSDPPLMYITYRNSDTNTAFQEISSIVSSSDSLAAESNAAKRVLVEEKLVEDLLFIADTSRHILVSLYAIYSSKFESNYGSEKAFYNSYLQRWEKQENAYFNSFKKKLPIKPTENLFLILSIVISVALLILVFYFKNYGLSPEKGFQKLSIQERKIFELLRKGATNQEISDQCNIGVSTVKSHVSSIYAKLSIKSRKDIMNLKM